MYNRHTCRSASPMWEDVAAEDWWSHYRFRSFLQAPTPGTALQEHSYKRFRASTRPPPHPPRCSKLSFSRCFRALRSSSSKAPLLSTSCQTISSVVSKVFWCCLNSYRSAIITAFSFSSSIWSDNWGGGGGGGGVKNRMHTESERIFGHLAEQMYTCKSVGYIKEVFENIVRVWRDAVPIFTSSFFPLIRDAAVDISGCFAYNFPLPLLLYITVSLPWERKEISWADGGNITQWAREVGGSAACLAPDSSL